MEAAASLAEEPGTKVTLSYRGTTFGRARAKNRDLVKSLASANRISVLFGSTINQIGRDTVELKLDDGVKRIKNDAVVICAGGILPSEFLNSVGIAMETKYGTA